VARNPPLDQEKRERARSPFGTNGNFPLILTPTKTIQRVTKTLA
jgi:hypothetical protein